MTYTEASTNVIGRSNDSATLDGNDRRKKLIVTNTTNGAVLFVKLSDHAGAVSVSDHDFVLTARQTNGATLVLNNYTGPVKASATTVNFVELG